MSADQVLELLNDDRLWHAFTEGRGRITSTRASRLLGISYRRLDHYARSGNVPLYRISPGKTGPGNSRLYDQEGLRALFILSRLADARHLPEQAPTIGARQVIAELRQICLEVERALPAIEVDV